MFDVDEEGGPVVVVGAAVAAVVLVRGGEELPHVAEQEQPNDEDADPVGRMVHICDMGESCDIES